MKVTINIPKEFEKDLMKDGFKDSLERLKVDAEGILVGKYEIEVIDMLIEAFKDADFK